MLGDLENQLIVSCQPVKGSAMDRPEIVAAYAQSIVDGGAAALRIEGLANLSAVRKTTAVPIIGLVKRDLADCEIRITPYAQDVRELVDAGADIIAFDATRRPRPEAVADLIETTRSAGATCMADCSSVEDGRDAHRMGADLLATTMSGYTGEAVPCNPDLDLVRSLRQVTRYVIAEGRYQTPAQAGEAIRAGAYAVVIGSAITRPEFVTDWFKTAIRDAAGGES